MGNLIEFNDDQKRIIKDQFFPPATTPADMQYCVNVAAELGLNPILKEIYFVERKAQINGQWHTKIEPMVGKAAWLKIAHNTGLLEGYEVDVNIEPTPTMIDGKWTMVDDLVATAIIHKKDSNIPFSISVSYSEYVARDRSGNVTKFWKDKPQTMLRKVALAQGLREAFNISGVYDESEINEEVNTKLDGYSSPELMEAIKEKPKRKRRTRAEIEAEQRANEEAFAEAEVLEEDMLDGVEVEKASETLPNPLDDPQGKLDV